MANEENIAAYDHHRGSDPLLRPARRWRKITFLSLDFIGFAGVCVFWQYLATGRWLDLSVEAYRRGLTTRLSDVFAEPLSIFAHPWMILVCGMLLAAMFFLPIVMAVLYHEFYAMLMVLMVAGIGHLMGLALFQAAGCILAARTRLRSDMPFVATLLGMLPLGAYVYLFAFAVTDSPAALPLQRWILCAPVALAAMLSILGAAGVLALTKLTGFRPGVIWPVLVVFLGVPVAVFCTQVGPDELDYAVVAQPLAGPDSLLESVTLENWCNQNNAQGLNHHTLRNRITGDLEDRRGRLIDGCERFLAKYPRSDRASAILWVAAQASSLTLDEAAYNGGLVKHRASPPSASSRPFWLRLAEEYPGSPHAALAGWRLGELALRARQTKDAYEQLHTAADRLRALLADGIDATEEQEPGQMFSSMRAIPAERNLEYYENALLDVERLVWLMEQNGVLEDARSAEALSAQLALDPSSPDYGERLARLAGLYEDTNMGDNLKLAVAEATSDPYQKATMLIALSENQLTDAAIEANYALGRLAMKTAEAPALPLLTKLKSPDTYFKAVIAARDNPWQRRAAARLAWLAARPRTHP
jgi:hypothetical protein